MAAAANPNFLVRDPRRLRDLLPHQYLRVNTIFEVVKAHGGYTAWTDKHPVVRMDQWSERQGCR